MRQERPSGKPGGLFLLGFFLARKRRQLRSYSEGACHRLLREARPDDKLLRMRSETASENAATCALRVGAGTRYRRASPRNRFGVRRGPGGALLSATVILVCLDGPVEITVQVRVTGITGSNKSGTKPAAGWVRRITVNTWSRPRSWIDPDMPGPDVLAPVGFTQVVDRYNFAGDFGDRRGPPDWCSKCDGAGNQQRRTGDCKHDVSHRSLSIPDWDTRRCAGREAQAGLFRRYSSLPQRRSKEIFSSRPEAAVTS